MPLSVPHTYAKIIWPKCAILAYYATLNLYRKLYTNDDLLDLIFNPNRKNQSAISPLAAKSVAKTGQLSNRLFKIEILTRLACIKVPVR